jgi:hypothetical protein
MSGLLAGIGITLLDAGLLLGLLSAIVPTIIHLISRRRARRVRFAPMELLLRSQKRTARSIRLRQFLLLLVRTLLLLMLAAAVLRPLLSDEAPTDQSTAPVVVVVGLDMSASMQARVDGRTAFDEARASARELLGALPDDVRVGIVGCDREPRDLVAPTFDRNAALQALEALTVTASWGDLGACVARAAALARTDDTAAGVAESAGERRVVLISDLAAHGFPRGAVPDAPGLQIELRVVGDDEAPPNHGIVDVAAAPSSQGLAVRFGAVRYGGPAVEVNADLFVDGSRGPRLALPFSPQSPRVERTFTVPMPGPRREAGSGTLSVVLDDDALALDNSLVIADDDRPRLKVLVVDGEPDAVPFADEVFYLAQALSSSRMGSAGQSRLDVQIVVPEKLDAASLAGVDVVVLANVARLDDAAAAALVSHVGAGAGLFITSGDQMDTETWNRQLGSVLPAVLRGTKQQALLDDVTVAEVLGLGRFELGHPVLRALAGTATDALPGLARVRTTATMLVEPAPGADRAVLARFSNDAPALLERAVGPGGRGRVLLLTTSVDREWTDLPIRPGFLPLMEQIVLYLGRGLDDGRPRTVRVGEPRALRLPAGADAAVVTRPDGQTVTLEVGDGNHEQLVFTGTVQPGLHRVAARVGDERVPLPAERFTVTLDPREMDLRRIDDDALRAALPGGAVVRRDRADRPGEPLWPFLLLAAVAFLLVESALTRRGDRAP